jgi:hypothetical protein
MEVVVIIASLVAIPVVIMFGPNTVSAQIARRKGRTELDIREKATWLTIAILVPEIAILVAIPPVRRLFDSQSDWGVAIIVGGIVAATVFAQIVALTILVVSWPQARRFSGLKRTRMPYGVLLLCALTAAVAGLLLGLAGAWPWQLVGAWDMATVPLIFIFTYRRRRAQTPDALAETQRDSRPPVLYVRPFTGDTYLFGLNRRTDREHFTEYFRSGGVPTKTLQTFEEFFGDIFRGELGPFIALGNPTDQLAPLGGAARVYAEDDSWQDLFTLFLSRACCVVATFDLSESTAWEFRLIRQYGFLDKLFC